MWKVGSLTLISLWLTTFESSSKANSNYTFESFSQKEIFIPINRPISNIYIQSFLMSMLFRLQKHDKNITECIGDGV